jgi:cobalt/nickel transport system ATP-binding protein
MIDPREPIVEVTALAFQYPDGTQALKDVTFRLVPGEAVALIGANGAGKSTLLLHLNGSAAPSHGTVAIGGNPVEPGTLEAVRRMVGMVFQDPDDQLFMPTVQEDVAFGPQNLGLGPQEVARRVAEALATVDLTALAGKPPYHLSAGEKRRAAIAAVLAMAPEILVMDEPTTGLDSRSRRQLMELLKGFGHTMLIATHDLDLVLEVCERTIVLHQGAVQADGPTRAIFSDAGLLATCHLEQPLSMQACRECRLLPPV